MREGKKKKQKKQKREREKKKHEPREDSVFYDVELKASTKYKDGCKFIAASVSLKYIYIYNP